MVSEASLFGLSMLGTVVGSMIMLYGVVLTAGQSANTPTVLGGAIVLGAVLLHTGTLMRLRDRHGAA